MQSRFAHFRARLLSIFRTIWHANISYHSGWHISYVAALPRTNGTLHHHQLRGDASKLMVHEVLSVSAVIATRNRAASLTRMLSSLRQHATRPAEIVVIDDS